MRRTILAELALYCSNADNFIEARPCRARQSIGRTLIIPFGRVEDDSIAPSAALEWNAAIGKRPSPWAEEIDDEPSNGARGRPTPALAPPARTANGGGVLVACAAAMPLIVFAVAVAVDYANVARFTTRVQLAADAAAAAVSKTIARNPNVDGRDVDQIAERIAAFVFARNAPRGARRGADGCNNGPRLRRHDDGRLSGCGAEQFRLRAWLWRDQRQGCGDVARARRRFPSDPRSLRLGCRRGPTGQAGRRAHIHGRLPGNGSLFARRVSDKGGAPTPLSPAKARSLDRLRKRSPNSRSMTPELD